MKGGISVIDVLYSFPVIYLSHCPTKKLLFDLEAMVKPVTYCKFMLIPPFIERRSFIL